MSSSAWVLMEDECDCGGPPPVFHLPPPPVPPDIPCELLDMTCPSTLNVSDAEFKRIGSFPSLTVIILCTLVSAVILLVIAGVVWRYFILRKRRKGVTTSKDFDHHHPHLGPGPTTTMIPGPTGLLYEDLTHARPRPPIATPSIEMLDVNHPHGLGGHSSSSSSSNGLMGNSKLDFTYFLNPPPIYEELPELDGEGSDRNGGPSDDEFAEDELSVIDMPVHGGTGTGEEGASGGGPEPTHPSSSLGGARYHPHGQGGSSSSRGSRSRVQSLNRRRSSGRSPGPGPGPGGPTGFKSQRSLDRHGRKGANITPSKHPGTNPRLYGGRSAMGISTDPSGSGMLILSDRSGMTMKIPPHLVAVLTESALCGAGGPASRTYEVIPEGRLGHPDGRMMMPVPGGLVNSGLAQAGVYPSSRSSGSSYGGGDGSSSSSARINPNGNSVESSSFDSGIGPHSIASFANSPAYEHAAPPPPHVLSPQYPQPTSPYDYATAPGGTPTQFVTTQQQHPSFRRLRMQPSDRDHPLYNNHQQHHRRPSER